MYPGAHAETHAGQARLRHGRHRRRGHLRRARRPVEPARPAALRPGAPSRRQRRHLHGEQRPLPRGDVGRPALRPLLHVRELAADGRRGGVHRQRLRRQGVHHLGGQAGAGRRAGRQDPQRPHPAHGRRHHRGLRALRGRGRRLPGRADRRRARGRRHALQLGHHRPAQGRQARPPEGQIGENVGRRGDAGPGPLRVHRRDASTSRPRRSTTPPRCASSWRRTASAAPWW